MIAYHDGAWLDEGDVRVPVRDAAFQSGHGVFESVRLHRARFFRMRAHLERLAASAALLRIDLPPVDALAAILAELAARARLDEASARLIVTAGTGRAAPSVIATISPIAADWRERAARGWSLITAATRHPDPRSIPPTLKSLGRVYSVLARQEAADASVDDALMLLPDGTVAEGPTWNFFFLADGVLHTASTDAVLGGVTRSVVIDLAGTAGVPLSVGLPPATLLAGADAAFASMSSLGLVPINALDGRMLPGSGALVAPLQAAYWALVEQEVTHAA